MAPGEDTERVLRTEYSILDEASLVPSGNVLSPPPNQFTHRVARTAGFYYEDSTASADPDGDLLEGTDVVLLRRDGSRCRVVDGQGLYVEIDEAALDPLPPTQR